MSISVNHMEQFNTYLKKTGEIGFVETVNNTVVSISGLPNAKPHEIIILESGEKGLILSLHAELCDVLLFSKNSIKTGTKATRTDDVFSVSAGMHLLGKTIDSFGRSLKSGDIENLDSTSALPVDITPLGIEYRSRITETFQTGVAIVDLVLPLGKGQRELIIGDRKTGKSTFLMSSMTMQARLGAVCIYVAIGKKKLSYKAIEENLTNNGVMGNCIIVASSSTDAPVNIFLTPYTGMSIAEYFRDLGREVFIIFDDLTTHAKYYRQISLLMKRFPGRNSYPADIFYAHSRLLERAGNFKVKLDDEEEKICSITCFPVAETVQGDLSGYIQTNLMSITDGHLYFDIDLFGKGRRPPVHPFLSVTRIGRQTQNSLRQTLSREIFSFFSLYEKMQNFTHFGAEVSETIASTLQTGAKITAFFDYISMKQVDIDLQIFLFSLLWVDLWKGKGIDMMKVDMDKIISIYQKEEIFRQEILSLMQESDSFNKFLGGIRGKPEDFYKKIGF